MPHSLDQPDPPPAPYVATEAETAADPDWFREPTPREHRIAAALFVGFGGFFFLLSVVLQGWWFRWVILSLGVISLLHGLWHAAVAARRPPSTDPPPLASTGGVSAVSGVSDDPKSKIQNPKFL